ncbi:MAG: MerR family transcriptional regulator [Altibacter sp.]|uniref:MerR family transcriptional regulator n=1 Tax=Altibacter sp. TaxID=2024823 RepID=UPI001D4E32F1|nr:MerR family transcriptional regulator [Altibacter sp.]MBZ0326826.1 MerR family transcriptional regulator [Altibacter sp.]
MSVKTQFSIKDLENLSNVKAHTIRIWEKRYNLLTPSRTDTNIRTYNLENLKKLLNVTFLYNNGFKISKIAQLSNLQLQELIQKEAVEREGEIAQKVFKMAMFDFDYLRFNTTFHQLAETKSFREIFFDVFLPLLSDIGLLWQSGSIDPAHERFISELIKQKVILQIETAQQEFQQKNDRIFALYLPYQEIHEIGLLYCNFEILSAGFKTIYLGNNIPMDSLHYVLKHHENVTFLSYFTVEPQLQSLQDYLHTFDTEVCGHKSCSLWAMGNKTREMESIKLPKCVRLIPNLNTLIDALETLKFS